MELLIRTGSLGSWIEGFRVMGFGEFRSSGLDVGLCGSGEVSGLGSLGILEDGALRS